MASAPKAPARGAPRRVLLATPRGYCAGVDRAVQTVEEALDLHGPPVYVRKEIVHNKHVVAQLAERGAIFVEEETEVPEGALVVFSAHGVAPKVHENARQRAPAHDRRNLPPGHQGPRRGPQVRRAGLHDRAHRSRRPRGGRGDDRRGAGQHRAGRDRRGRGLPRGPRPGKGRLHHPDDAVGRRDAGAHRSPAREVPRDRRPEVRRHLLCDHQPPDRRQAAGARMRPGAGHRLDQLLELESPRRGGTRARRRLASDRQLASGRGGVASRASRPSGSRPEQALPRSWSPSSSASSAIAGPKTLWSCGRSTKTSASCSRRRSGPSWLPGVE